MKTISLAVVLLLGSSWAYGQNIEENKVLAGVENNFRNTFTNATDVEWEKQGDQYHVDFEMYPNSCFNAWYESSGMLIRCTEKIAFKDLPQSVIDSLRASYVGYRSDVVKKATENNIETYVVGLEEGGDELHLAFSKNGELIDCR